MTKKFKSKRLKKIQPSKIDEKQNESSGLGKSDQIILREITEELKSAYLDYAMSVIISRALPDVRDGLKPVQRRILYAMSEAGFWHSSKFRKSASIVGEVLGKYHPHGDVPVYDALARMAQSFSLRYPLIEGQGNWGSIDGDPPAAMRYTEARLAVLAEEMLKDLDKETVPFQDNYDGTRKEPLVLPARLPNLLINGTSGIAVGMATSIPPHNLGEVCDALIYLVDHPNAEVKDLLQLIQGPDFPTGGVIYNRQSLEELYASGRGTITVRATVEVQERKAGQADLVVSDIPYQVNKADLLAKIAELVQDKRIEGIRDIRDESDKEGLQITIQLKNDAHPQKVLNNLYKHTDLQKNFHVNFLALVEGIQPQTLSLKGLLEEFIKHRQAIVYKRSQFDLKKAKDRLHILEGLLKALKNIDAVIKTIKTSKNRDEAKEKLIKQFKLTVIQAEAILEMKLQTLVGLERQKIEEEAKLKEKEIKELEEILKNPKKILQIIKDETLEIKKKYADDRKTRVLNIPIGEFKEEDLIPDQEVVIMMSQDGYIKAFEPEIIKNQKRGGKGMIGFDVKEEDRIQHVLLANTHDNLLFATSSGRVFQLRAFEIPMATRTARGRSIFNFLDLSKEDKIAAIMVYPNQQSKKSGYLVMVTKNGIMKKMNLTEFANVRRSGLIAMKLKEGDELKDAKIVEPNDEIIVLSAYGQALRFQEKDLRPMGRSAAGVLGIRLKTEKDNEVRGFDVIKPELKDGMLLVVMEKGFGKRTALKEYRLQHRGGQGIKTAKISEKTGKVVAIKVIAKDTKQVLLISKKGILIKTDLGNISQQSRIAQGVRIIRLDPDDVVAGIVVL
ncbi:MAG: DNA gyrase subunit A [Candidatus Paceibacterota bacterium]|nr:DNA gyrase subunit A [Candidatus Paceibacterota bacterium]